ncbi:hypothetical protein F511_11998 [Dorcoceras hygrometricum]|uniref:Uncharacterized protein n=1 Tax=Dorcoceras hygrometricum TaxID=472368 RepID=A0A2Z7BQZ9_9LAMI|nr:hypothetical protein F511_11998 [Dorcoceras hygrometricum]
MGCPGQARTKPRRKIVVASLPEIRRTAAAANIACGAWPHAATPSAASPATLCAKHGAQIAHHRIQLAVGPQPLWLRNHNFGLAQRTMVKHLATSPHDPLDIIGYPRMKASGESSTTKHRLLHASGPHPISPPNDPKYINQLVGNQLGMEQSWSLEAAQEQERAEQAQLQTKRGADAELLKNRLKMKSNQLDEDAS